MKMKSCTTEGVNRSKSSNITTIGHVPESGKKKEEYVVIKKQKPKLETVRVKLKIVYMYVGQS